MPYNLSEYEGNKENQCFLSSKPTSKRRSRQFVAIDLIMFSNLRFYSQFFIIFEGKILSTMTIFLYVWNNFFNVASDFIFDLNFIGVR